MFALLLLLALALAGAGAAPSPPLVCTARADAVALVEGACPLRLDCRYQFGADATLVLSLAEWDTLLVQQTALLSDDPAAVLSDDMRFRYLAAPYVTLPLMAYDPGNTSGAAVDCAVLLQASLLDPGAALIPDQVFAVLSWLGQYEYFESPSAQCPDDNDVFTWVNTTSAGPAIVCQCAPGKICTAGNATVSTIMVVVGILACALILGLFLFVVVTAPLMLRSAGLLLRKRLPQAEQDLETTPLRPLL